MEQQPVGNFGDGAFCRVAQAGHSAHLQSRGGLRGHDRPPEIHEAVHNLRHALQMHHGRWSAEEILRVRDLLNDTAKAIVDGPAVQPATEKAE